MTVRQLIEAECDAVKAMLLKKNDSYGDSAIHPIRIFSSADTAEQLRVRIDDKLSRIAKGDGYAQEDAELDIIGYLFLLRVHRRIEEVSP